MSKLSKYLKEAKISQTDFAGKVGISRSHLCEILSGEKSPSLDVAKKISKGTGGSVRVSDWPQFKAVIDAVSGEGAAA